VIARSKEAKALGIPMGIPFYQLQQRFRNGEVAVFSSNYELIYDMTGRVMKMISDAAPSFYRYSVDEAFCLLDGMNPQNLKDWGEQLHRRVLQGTGMPISTGIAQTKTLAKMASHYAKKYDGYKHCCVIDSEEKRLKALELYPIDEVWGIGRRHAARLQSYGIRTALDFALCKCDWIRLNFNVVGTRTWMELNGIDCVPNETVVKKKSICTSRSFDGMLTSIEDVRTQVSNYAAMCAEKLRRQGSVAATVGLFIDTNHFREDLPQRCAYDEERLLTPANSTATIVHTTAKLLSRIFREGYHYKRAGVIVKDITGAQAIQTNLIDYDAERHGKLTRLDTAIDCINKIYGKETVVIASRQYKVKDATGKAKVFAEAVKHDYKSKNPTTRWSDIITLK